MLTRSTDRALWWTAAAAAFGFLVAGVGVAVALETTGAPSTTAATELIDHGGPHCNNPNNPNCELEEEEPGEEPDDDGGGGGGSGGEGCYWTRDTTVTVSLPVDDHTERIEIPCVHDSWGWYGGVREGGYGCYYGDYPAEYPPPTEPPEGEDPEDGRWYFLTCFSDAYYSGGELVFILITPIVEDWVDNADVPTVTPEQVALNWLATVPLHGVEFQLAPPETGAGLVGLPVWLGVGESEMSWGPTGDTHCIDDVCVSLDAEVVSVDWDMGDGTVVTCARDRHVVWQPGMDFRAPGDNCHHLYERSSRDLPDRKYQILATSNWEVTWSSDVSTAGGELETERESEVALQIDEIQVLTR